MTQPQAQEQQPSPVSSPSTAALPPPPPPPPLPASPTSPPRSPSSAPASPAQAQAQVRRQVEHYFSQDNLAKDVYLRSAAMMDSDGFVFVSAIAKFNMVQRKAAGMSLAQVVDALRSSSILQLGCVPSQRQQQDGREPTSIDEPELVKVRTADKPHVFVMPGAEPSRCVPFPPGF